MDAALRIHGFLVDLEVIEPWYEGFCTDLTEDKVKEIKLYILKLYKGRTSTDTPVILAERPSSQLEDISSDEDDVEITSLSTSDKTFTRLERTLSSSQLEGALHTQLEKGSSLSETTLSEKPSFPSDKPSFQLENASLPSEISSQLEKTSASLDKPSSDLLSSENLSSKLETDRPSSELEDISSSSTEEGEISD
ncbi:hypothetical protein TNCV_2392861 [Trichonephila clavipes]|nr:hypothetical protein TNCV_2392861 [Trichonephila clavipes]